jgi:DNA end-binding protein Ku
MATRPIWKGYISFGLVSIPIVLYPAEKKFDIQFKLLDSRDHARIKYLRVNENTGEEVPWNNIAKGYEYDENNYVLLKNEDIKSIGGEATKTIDIESFVNKNNLNCMDFDKPYYLVPDKKNEKGYVILRETLNNTKKVGIAKVVIHTRQYLAVVMPYENALVLNILHYHKEIRKPSEFELPSENIQDYKIVPKELEVAKQLVDSMTIKWNPDDYHDEFREELQTWIEDKIHHVQSKPSKKGKTRATASNVINFVDLLKKSLKTNKGQRKKRVKGG